MNAYDACVRILRDGGCRCPLLWTGTICKPATICEQQPADSPDRRSCRVLASLPPVPTAEPSTTDVHGSCSDDSAT